MQIQGIIDELERAVEISNALYDQGGLIFKYQNGNGRRHIDIQDTANLDFINRLGLNEITKFECFFENALSGYNSNSISQEVKEYCSKLIGMFNEQYDGWNLSIKEEKDDTSISLCALYIEGNNYHLYDLFWSVD